MPEELRDRKITWKRNYLGVAAGIALVLVILIVAGWKSGILVRSAAPLPVSTLNIIKAGVTPSPETTDQADIPNGITSQKETATYLPTLAPTSTPMPTDTSVRETSTEIATNTESPYPSTATATVCVPPPGWVTYIVQPNDTLSYLGQEFGVTVADLQKANCMGTSVTIYTGHSIYVPNVATRTPSINPTKAPTRTEAPTEIYATPTDTPLPVPTDTPLPTDTPQPTDTQLPSNTPVPTATLTPPPLPTNTLTPPPSRFGHGG
jgi:LysM repeat protein